MFYLVCCTHQVPVFYFLLKYHLIPVITAAATAATAADAGEGALYWCCSIIYVATAAPGAPAAALYCWSSTEII